MRKYVKYIIMLAFVSLFFGGCNSNREGGQTAYPFDYVWEVEGNSVMIVDAYALDIYHTSDGATYQPEEGKMYIILECKVKFAEDWKISDRTYLHPLAYDNPETYVTLCDNTGVPDSNGYDSCILLFEIDKLSYPGTISDYVVEIWIQQSDKRFQTQNFCLRAPKK